MPKFYYYNNAKNLAKIWVIVIMLKNKLPKFRDLYYCNNAENFWSENFF